MGKNEFCYLCRLESDFFPSKGALHGISCKRCGDYYMDDFLIECGEPKKAEDKAILSGYARWEKELGHPIPEIKNENYEEIIQDNKSYSDTEKVDKLLLYYSKKYPDKGSYANYDYNLDYPITFSKGSDEFLYLLLEVAYKSFGYLEVLARGVLKITPKGWNRKEWLNKIELADRKYNIEREKINKNVNGIESDLKEKAGIVNMRWSTPLARNIGDIYFQGIMEKLEKKLEIDKQIILGSQVVTKDDDINFLFGRVKKLADFEKIFLAERIKEIYQDCRQQKHLEHDIEEIFIKVDKKTKEILVDLKAEELQKEEARIPELPEIDVSKLVTMDEGKQLEFKSTLQWDIEKGCKNKELRNEVVRTIAAFNNTEGGNLIIGVTDDKKIFGLEKDYELFKSPKKRDIFLQTLCNVLGDKISREFPALIDIKLYELGGKDICIIRVNFGDEPVWVKENQKDEVFYIRAQNSEKSLSCKESGLYIKKRWREPD